MDRKLLGAALSIFFTLTGAFAAEKGEFRGSLETTSSIDEAEIFTLHQPTSFDLRFKATKRNAKYICAAYGATFTGEMESVRIKDGAYASYDRRGRVIGTAFFGGMPGDSFAASRSFRAIETLKCRSNK